jgi:hypothetical protein
MDEPRNTRRIASGESPARRRAARRRYTSGAVPLLAPCAVAVLACGKRRLKIHDPTRRIAKCSRHRMNPCLAATSRKRRRIAARSNSEQGAARRRSDRPNYLHAQNVSAVDLD